jgi:hypothetical protein
MQREHVTELLSRTRIVTAQPKVFIPMKSEPFILLTKYIENVTNTWTHNMHLVLLLLLLLLLAGWYFI